MNLNTLLYWHKLEHFYPYVLEEQHNENIKTYYINKKNDFPNYENPNIPDDKCVRYYEIYLGIFKVDSALKVLATNINAENEFHDESDEKSCFCKFRVSDTGLFDQESFKISSFPWAINRVKANKISVESWKEEFEAFHRMLFLRFFDCAEIIDFETLSEIKNDIIELMDWEIEFDDFWIRVDCVVGDKRQDYSVKKEELLEDKEDIDEKNMAIDELIKNNDLLNSFYVRDIERVIRHIDMRDYNEGIEKFVDHKATKKINVEKDINALFEIFNPQYMPMGKWPSGFSLRAMQQVAVNLSMSEALSSEKVFSVNGPPGTGKTTLLRDIIAAKVVERAIRLLELDKPNDAFGQQVSDFEYKGHNAHIKDIKDNLKMGILVASNNNSAVKNITHDLPKVDSIGSKYRGEYTYFSEVSNRLLKQETWGICSAALGNLGNRIEFISNFWPIEESKEFDFNKYLRSLHSKETKRTHQECVINWEKAKERFSRKKEDVELIYNKMQECYDTISKIKSISNELISLNSDYIQYYSDYDSQNMLLNQKKYEHKSLKDNITNIANRLDIIRNSTPFFKIRYLFKCQLLEYKSLENDLNKYCVQEREMENVIQCIQGKVTSLVNLINSRYSEIQERNTFLCNADRYIKEWSKYYGSEIPSAEYIDNLIGNNGQERKEKEQASAPWNGAKIIQLREELFLEAMELHKAFVENSSQMREQLDCFSKLMRGMVKDRDKRKEISTALIQSFQLVVPVISTTFASVGSFLKDVGRDAFSLLLIDEAGQALPQSAVGAIWRSDKSIIVGDPMQIEPVVTIHDKTIKFLKEYFGQSDFIASKETSVQSLADACNTYGGERNVGEEKMWIGSPLLVHGRCQKPIFDISNEIAYDNKMVYGTHSGDNVICRWVDVKGYAIDKHFVKEQADEILQLVVCELQKALEQGKVPSLFIISPFRSVKFGLVNYFKEKDSLYHSVCFTEDKEKKKIINKWIYENIGTIHTFQGKEAEQVIICLGVGSDKKGSQAVQWASKSPNILNVAVTRAKERLYIVGDVDVWSRQNYFSTAYKIATRDI